MAPCSHRKFGCGHFSCSFFCAAVGLAIDPRPRAHCSPQSQPRWLIGTHPASLATALLRWLRSPDRRPFGLRSLTNGNRPTARNRSRSVRSRWQLFVRCIFGLDDSLVTALLARAWCSFPKRRRVAYRAVPLRRVGLLPDCRPFVSVVRWRQTVAKQSTSRQSARFCIVGIAGVLLAVLLLLT